VGEHLDTVARAHDRMGALIEDLLALAREGEAATDVGPVDLAGVVREAWRNVDTAGARPVVETDRVVRADEGRLQQLLENLVRNAVEHGSTSPPSQARTDAVEHGSTTPRSRARGDAGGSDRGGAPTAADGEPGAAAVTVRVGDLEDGFYVEDDGPGIPPERREATLEPGHSTVPGGTGFGLNIVRRIAEAHGWSLSVAEGAEGGARFEFAGVEFEHT
jgi:signal transduction histidine kinase